VPDTIRRIVSSLKQPAYVIGARWDVLAWNRAATRALTDFARVKEEDRNILIFVLTDPSAPRSSAQTGRRLRGAW
jgi:MmyB-like transcription regulator ligand binding domain